MLIYIKNKIFDVICILEKIEKDLNIEEFVRCYKSYIINLNYVENIKLNIVILDS